MNVATKSATPGQNAIMSHLGSYAEANNNEGSSDNEEDVKLLLADEVLAPSQFDDVDPVDPSSLGRVRRPIPVPKTSNQARHPITQMQYERNGSLAVHHHSSPGFQPRGHLQSNHTAPSLRPSQNTERSLLHGHNSSALDYQRFNPTTTGFMKLSTGSYNVNRMNSTSLHHFPPPSTKAKVTSHNPMPITTKDIVQAIPENASCVFHILDRRVNFDAHPEDASLYSLLRSWVQDDPYRQVPPQDDYTETVVCQSPPLVAESKPSSLERCPVDGQLREQGTNEEVDTLFKMKIAKTVDPSIRMLRKDLVARARRTKKEKIRSRSIRTAAARESLKRRGIIL